MPRRFGILALVGALLLVTGEARAQAPAGMEETVRPATTSVYGDTGLWFVPTGEVLRNGTWSASAYRLNWDVRQGFTDISHFEGTFAYGVKGRAEIFGAIRFITRIDRDTRPIFGFGGDKYGGVDNNYPFVREGWIGNDFGDTFLGAKVSLLSESRQSPVALAIRGMLKVPTGSDEGGAGTGKMDYQLDFIVSKEIASTAEVSGSIGYRHRGDPDAYEERLRCERHARRRERRAQPTGGALKSPAGSASRDGSLAAPVQRGGARLASPLSHIAQEVR